MEEDAGWVRAARRLLVDRTTAEVVGTLEKAGVRALLLKGPVIARWLYDNDAAERAYSDVDLLVAPEQFEPATAALAVLGFSAAATVRLQGERVPHALLFERPETVPVDLHRSLHDLEDVSPALVWEAVSTGSERITVAGMRIETPGPIARTLHVVLHVSMEEPPTSMAAQDLRRALCRVDVDTWRGAAMLARRLGIEDMMAAKLRLVPGGAELAETIGLAVGPLPVRLLTTREENSPPYVHTLSRLAELPGARARFRYLRAKAFPTRSFLRQWTPIARWGGPGLALAYVLRIGWILLGLPIAPLLWWRARRQARQAAAARSSGEEP